MQRRITSSYYNYYYKTKVKLLGSIVASFKYKNPDELMAIAKVKLLYAMIHYNNQLGSFNNYLYRTIHGNILKNIRRERNLCKNIYDNTVVSVSKNTSQDDSIFIREVLEKLSERERNILVMYYLENNTLREISEKLDISSNCVFTSKNKAIKKIRETYAT